MNILNYEFKARVSSLAYYENLLLSLNPVFHGTDHQVDTYFRATHGRLKLREGNIENALIQYDRHDVAGSKESRIVLYRHAPDPALKAILTAQLGVQVVISKTRRIYFIDNVKFHFDEVENLGTFIEVEAIGSEDGSPRSLSGGGSISPKDVAQNTHRLEKPKMAKSLDEGQNKPNLTIDQLKAQCDHYAAFFGLTSESYIDRSYSDMLLKMNLLTST